MSVCPQVHLQVGRCVANAQHFVLQFKNKHFNRKFYKIQIFATSFNSIVFASNGVFTQQKLFVTFGLSTSKLWVLIENFIMYNTFINIFATTVNFTFFALNVVFSTYIITAYIRAICVSLCLHVSLFMFWFFFQSVCLVVCWHICLSLVYGQFVFLSLFYGQCVLFFVKFAYSGWVEVGLLYCLQGKGKI